MPKVCRDRPVAKTPPRPPVTPPPIVPWRGRFGHELVTPQTEYCVTPHTVLRKTTNSDMRASLLRPRSMSVCCSPQFSGGSLCFQSAIKAGMPVTSCPLTTLGIRFKSAYGIEWYSTLSQSRNQGTGMTWISKWSNVGILDDWSDRFQSCTTQTI